MQPFNILIDVFHPFPKLLRYITLVIYNSVTSIEELGGVLETRVL